MSQFFSQALSFSLAFPWRHMLCFILGSSFPLGILIPEPHRFQTPANESWWLVSKTHLGDSFNAALVFLRELIGFRLDLRWPWQPRPAGSTHPTQHSGTPLLPKMHAYFLGCNGLENADKHILLQRINISLTSHKLETWLCCVVAQGPLKIMPVLGNTRFLKWYIIHYS